jgi:hypothetical protein
LQGSALSNFLFCLVTSHILEELGQKYELVAFVDDIAIGIDDNINP